MTRTGKIVPAILVIGALCLVAYQVLKAGSITVTRTWTAPADPKPDGRRVPVVAYQFYFGTDSATFAANPLTGTPVAMLRSPKAPGQAETLLVVVPDDRRIFYRVRAQDSAGNWSAWSNRFAETTPDRTPPDSVADVK